ncbi:MAG TPA: hypothetical protein VNM92_05690 [Thermoanaerobaculia bacterium]|nr:hypothetical protein [Thermoanaerobaculia bacterium]
MTAALRVATLLAVLALPTPLEADAWPRGRKAAYIYAGAAKAEASDAFDPEGKLGPILGRGVRQERLNAYVELGLSDVATLVVSAPYERVTARGFFNDFRTDGAGDLDLRLRLSRVGAGGALAVEGGAFIPLGYDTLAFPQLGSGSVEPIVNLAYGRSVRWLPSGFLSVQVGHRWRGGDLSNELPYSAKLGTFLHERVGTFVFLRGWESRGDFASIDPAFAFTGADSERSSAGGELYVRVTRTIDMNATWMRTIGGRNSAAGDEFSVGFAVNLR